MRSATAGDLSFRPSAIPPTRQMWISCQAVLRNKTVTKHVAQVMEVREVRRFTAGSAAFMFKSFSSAEGGWHKPASLWSPTQHMKNEKLHCQLIHLHKSLSRDANLKVQWHGGIRRVNNTARHRGGRQRKATLKSPYFIVYYKPAYFQIILCVSAQNGVVH